jgi:hypothetical protein
MYYVINLKTEIKGKKSEVYVFPFINRAKDIVSGQLNLESHSVYNLSEKYDTLFETRNGNEDEKLIEKSVNDIVYAHIGIPIIGVFKDGVYDSKLTSLAFNYAKSKELSVEGLFESCKI